MRENVTLSNFDELTFINKHSVITNYLIELIQIVNIADGEQ